MDAKLKKEVRSFTDFIKKEQKSPLIGNSISIVYAAAVIESVINKRFRKYKYSLNHSSFSLLYVLIENGGSMNLSQLNKRLPLSRQAVALTSRNIEKRGLVKREGVSNDLRKIRIHLTEKGLEVMRHIVELPSRRHFMRTLTSPLSEGESNQMTASLLKITNKLLGKK
jgi:DNA-binding MarR family transcriptional regulator